MRKLRSRWVPQLSDTDHKQKRSRLSQQHLCRLKKNTADFLHRFVTMGETWVHHATTETKQQSKQWVEKRWDCPKESKQNCVGRKGYGQCVLAFQRHFDTTFQRVQMENITEILFNSQMKEARDERFGLRKTKVPFHKDNA